MAFKNDGRQTQRVYFAHGGTGSGNGADAANALPIASGDLWAIPAGTVVENVYVVITSAISGSTALNVGDDDDADGYVPTASVTLGTAGMYGNDPDESGAYGVDSGGGRSHKYYAAAGKEVKLAVTGASTAGAGYVVIDYSRL